MNQAERRRKWLLEQTRNLYSDKENVPAVHPRYKATYNRLYKDETDWGRGLFGLRCGICIFLFAAYIVLGNSDYTILGMNNIQVQKVIMQNYVHKLY